MCFCFIYTFGAVVLKRPVQRAWEASLPPAPARRGARLAFGEASRSCSCSCSCISPGLRGPGAPGGPHPRPRSPALWPPHVPARPAPAPSCRGHHGNASTKQRAIPGKYEALRDLRPEPAQNSTERGASEGVRARSGFPVSFAANASGPDGRAARPPSVPAAPASLLWNLSSALECLSPGRAAASSRPGSRGPGHRQFSPARSAPRAPAAATPPGCGQPRFLRGLARDRCARA